MELVSTSYWMPRNGGRCVTTYTLRTKTGVICLDVEGDVVGPLPPLNLQPAAWNWGGNLQASTFDVTTSDDGVVRFRPRLLPTPPDVTLSSSGRG